MNELLAQLQAYSYQLYKLNMRQAAGDYDYFVAWIKSVDPNDENKHFGVAPAGENTIAPLANNCPIPYTVTKNSVKGCTNIEIAGIIIKQIKEIFSNISATVSDADETTAVNSFIEYTDKLLELIYGESPEPPGPVVVSKTAYTRAAAYQTLNKNITANSSNVLYEAGATVSLIVDNSKTYTLTGAFTNADAAVDTTDAYLTLLESGGQYYLRLIWGPNAAQVCYITYDEAE